MAYTMLEPVLAVGVTLAAALVLGEAVERAGEPAIIGEIAAGVVLGPHVFAAISPETPFFSAFATVGAVLLFFDVGYEELRLDDLLEAGLPAVAVALGGMALPFVSGVGVGRLFGYTGDALLFLGLGMAVTSIAVSARTLMDVGWLDSRAGHVVVGAAVVDDLVAVLAFTALVTGRAAGDGVAETLVGIAAFASALWLVHRFLLGRLAEALDSARQHDASFLGVMTAMFLGAGAAEAAGLEPSIGAFATGLVVGAEERFAALPIQERVDGVAYGVFVPLFFANVGAQLDLSVLRPDVFVTLVVALGLATKLVGAGVAALASGESRADAATVGVGMMPRTGVELVIVSTALSLGAIDQRIYAAFVVLVVVSVLVTPTALRLTVERFQLPRSQEGEQKEAEA